MLLAHTPDELYKIEQVFEDNASLQELILNRFTSLTPLILLSKAALMNIKGFGKARAQQTRNRLDEIGLEPARSNETLIKAIDRHFGCIEDAPVQVLSVVPQDGRPGAAVMAYQPLEFIDFIQEHYPRMAVIDVIECTKSVFLDQLCFTDMPFSVGELEAMVEELAGRLALHGLQFAPSEERRLTVV